MSSSAPRPSNPPALTDWASAQARPVALSHPLPAGMRDLLPSEARRQSVLARSILGTFELFGYQRVRLPAFEYADVLERGLGALQPQEVLRFVEPETGEVVALRPDMTPQVARLVSTRFADAPGPARLCYQGSVLRRRRQRARRHRQIQQAGIELIGSPAPEGDVEVLAVAAAALQAVGLEQFVIDLGHTRVATSLLEQVARERWPALVEALAQKDAVVLVQRAEQSGLSGPLLNALAELPGLHGPGEEVWPKAQRVLAGTPAEQPIAELQHVWEQAHKAGLGAQLTVDLGETYNYAYYTGILFQILAEGPGELVGSGGRYDGLLERFGTPRPAAGFALDLDNLTWALQSSGAGRSEPPRLLVAASASTGAASTDEVAALLTALRARGLRCAHAVDPAGASAYARAWGYSYLLRLGPGAAQLVRVADDSEQTLLPAAAAELAAEIAARLSSRDALAAQPGKVSE